jgi:hypothetical protein
MIAKRQPNGHAQGLGVPTGIEWGVTQDNGHLFHVSKSYSPASVSACRAQLSR